MLFHQEQGPGLHFSVSLSIQWALCTQPINKYFANILGPGQMTQNPPHSANILFGCWQATHYGWSTNATLHPIFYRTYFPAGFLAPRHNATLEQSDKTKYSIQFIINQSTRIHRTPIVYQKLNNNRTFFIQLCD